MTSGRILLMVVFTWVYGMLPGAYAAMNPALPPPENFNLIQWYLGLPVSETGALGAGVDPAEIDTPDLSDSSYYTQAPYTTLYAPYFYTGPDGAMIFKVPWNGANTSGSPRCELRETFPDGDLFNWTPVSNGGVHVLDATCVVNTVGVGKVAIGQIHAKEPNVPTVILRYDNTGASPVIYVTCKQDTNPNGPYTRFDYPGVALGAPIHYQLKMASDGNTVVFSCTVNGLTQSVEMPNPVWLTATNYFKAGCYYVATETGITAKVSFYQLDIHHSEGPQFLHDAFNDNDRTTQNLPSSAAWYGNTTTALSLSSKSLALSPGSSALAYLRTNGSPQTLGVGESMQTTFSLVATGSAFPTGNDFFRVALLNSSGTATDHNATATGSRISADGYNTGTTAFNNNAGYMMSTAINPSVANTMRARSRKFNATSGLMGTGSYDQIGTTGGGGAYGFIPNNTYTGALSVTRTDATTVSVTLKFLGTFAAGTGNTWSYTETHSSTATWTFDALAFYVSSGGSFASLKLDNITVDYVSTRLLSDDWTDGERSLQDPPVSAAWFGNNSTALVVTGNQLVVSPSGTGLAYFRPGTSPQTLAVGDALRVTFSLVATGSTFPTSNDFFRIALLNSSGSSTDHNEIDPANRVITDGYNTGTTAFNNYAGYMFTSPLNPASAATLKAYRRNFNATNGIISTASYTQLGTTGGGGAYGFVPGNLYTGTLTATRTATGTVSVTLSFSGTFAGGSGGTWSSTQTDSSAATVTFDTIATYVGSGGSFGSLKLDNVLVDYLPAP